MRKPLLVVSHVLFAAAGFAAGIYVLPILTAPPRLLRPTSPPQRPRPSSRGSSAVT